MARGVTARQRKPDIIFEQSIFSTRESGVGRNQAASIASGEELREAFERIQSDPTWNRGRGLPKASRRTSAEVVRLYNAVVSDGRFVRTFLQDPAEAARELEVKISKRGLQLASAIGSRVSDAAMPPGAAVVVSIAVVGAAVATAIQQSASDPRDRFVIDESGRLKL